jgi:hypothetical protein
MGSGSLSLHGALLDYGSHALRLNKGPLLFRLPLLAPAVRDGGDSPAPRMAMSSPMHMLSSHNEASGSAVSMAPTFV